ncbi:asparagine synthase-related protein [Oleisolibacter albus]|uniref:asparagine synthase-related protein n=1 Tax=Oleisolibacter albus TaxID=2171757 RepID=UPI0013900183|nr:asparagine synthase-related protein [Oleisolibacter albus]
MLHFAGAVGFHGHPPPLPPGPAGAACLGGSGFGPVTTHRGEDWIACCRAQAAQGGAEAPEGPVIGRNGHLVLIGSGRIDERRALLDALNLDPLLHWSDARLMLAAFERWGPDAADRLRGDFSFAVWDRAARRLVLARDTFGTVPLFYHRGKGCVWFGTNPAALLAMGGLPRDLDREGLGEHLIGRSADPEVTIYAALRRVRRAAVTTLLPGETRTNVYWTPGAAPMLRLKDDDAYVEATRAVLAQVLEGHLERSAPIGVMLSGGLDSGAIASTLAMLAPQREIFGFTTVPVAGAQALRDGAGREWEHVQRLARMHPNLRIRPVAEKTATPLDDMRSVFADIGMPMCTLVLMTRRLALAEAARQEGVGTLLRGDGGNWTLTAEGDGIFRALFRSGRWIALAREIAGTARYKNRSLARVLWSNALHDIVPRSMLEIWGKVRAPSPVYHGSFLRPEFARSSGLLARWASAPNAPERVARLHADEIVPVYLGAQPAHSETVTLMMNRMGLGWSAPLRDRRLVDFILSVPPEQFRRNGVPRYLARRVLADRMPAEALAEKGYFAPFADTGEWLARWWSEAGRRLADQHPVDMAGAAIDLPRLQALLDGPPPDISARREVYYEAAAAVPLALHVNDFIRWHAGRNH